MYCNIRYGTRLNTIVWLQSLKPIVGTLIEYLLDGDTLIIRIQCSVLEVLWCINHQTLTAENNLEKKKKSSTRKKKNNY